MSKTQCRAGHQLQQQEQRCCGDAGRSGAAGGRCGSRCSPSPFNTQVPSDLPLAALGFLFRNLQAEAPLTIPALPSSFCSAGGVGVTSSWLDECRCTLGGSW